MKPELKLALAIAILISLSTYVYAAEPSGVIITSEEDLGRYNGSSPDASTTAGGNVTKVHLSANISTLRWSGLTGNVTGLIVLEDENNDKLFSWSAIGRVVYASNESSITWSNLGNASSSDMPDYIIFTANDNYTNTFTDSGLLDSDMFTITAKRATTPSADGTTTWYTYSLNSSEGPVWAAEVKASGNSYANKTADYQMIVPEDGTGGNEASSLYYLWVELV